MLFGTKTFLLLTCTAIAVIAAEKFRPKIDKSLLAEIPRELKDLNRFEQAVKQLKALLIEYAATDGPYFKRYRVVSASGSSAWTDYVVDLVDMNNLVRRCVVTIMSQPWLEGDVESSFDCIGEERFEKRHRTRNGNGYLPPRTSSQGSIKA